MAHSHHSHHHHSSRPKRMGYFGRLRLRYRLWRWAKNKEIEGHHSHYVKRRYDYTLVYVDLYMNVHSKRDGACVAQYDTRCDWFNLKEAIDRMEANLRNADFKKKE